MKTLLVSRARVRERLALARKAVADLECAKDLYSFLDIVEKGEEGEPWRFSGQTLHEWLRAWDGAASGPEALLVQRLPDLVAEMFRQVRRELRDCHPDAFPIEVGRPPFSSYLLHRIEKAGPARATPQIWRGFLSNLAAISAEERAQLGVDRVVSLIETSVLTRVDLLSACSADSVSPCLSHEYHWRQSITSGQWLVSQGLLSTSQLKKAQLWRGRGITPIWQFAYEHQLFGWKICRAEYKDCFLPGCSEFWMALDHRGNRVSGADQAAYLTVDEAVNAAEKGIARLLFPDKRKQAKTAWECFTAATGRRYHEFLIQVPDWVPTHYGEHFEARNIVVHVRVAVRQVDGNQRVAFIEEIQSDWHTDIVSAKKGSDNRVAPAPYAKEWPLLALKTVLWWAQSIGVRYLAWATAQMQGRRWAGYDPPLRTYAKDIPKAANKIAAVLGAPVATIEVEDFSHCVQESEGAWWADDSAASPKRFWSRKQAEEFAAREGMGIPQMVPCIDLSAVDKIHRVPLYGVGDREFWFAEP